MIEQTQPTPERKPAENIEEISAAPETLRGQFVSSAVFRHKFDHFLIDCLYGAPDGKILVSRLIFTPQHMKRFQQALAENLRKYEEKYGQIPDPPQQPTQK